MAKKWYNLFVSVDAAKEAAEKGTPDAAPSAAQTVADIAASLGQAPAFSGPVSDPGSFDQIYAAAQIAPPAHGYTILKVAEMLQSPHIRDLPAGVKKSSVLVALEASGVNVQEIIQDAIRRDRALDSYEELQQQGLDGLIQKKTAENQAIQAEMDRLVAEHRARMQSNDEELARATETLRAWRVRKQQEEQKLGDAVSFFVTENPVTLSSAQTTPPPKPKERS